MFVALGHDFVLRRNVRIAFQTKPPTTQARNSLVHLAHGSHHLHLVNHSARQWNAACSEAKQMSLAHLPELPLPAPTNERFGLVGSNHVATFGGLLSGNSVKDDGALDLDLSAPHSDDEVEQAMSSLLSKTTELLISEYGIEEALFNVQLKGSTHLRPSKLSTVTKEGEVCHLTVDLTADDLNNQQDVSFSRFLSEDNLNI